LLFLCFFESLFRISVVRTTRWFEQAVGRGYVQVPANLGDLSGQKYFDKAGVFHSVGDRANIVVAVRADIIQITVSLWCQRALNSESVQCHHPSVTSATAHKFASRRILTPQYGGVPEIFLSITTCIYRVTLETR